MEWSSSYEVQQMILELIRILVGLPLLLFLPGYLVVLLLFKELGKIEKISLAFVISIFIDIVVGLFLGYNKYMKNLTGGITELNLWIYMTLITVFLLAIYIIKKKL